VSQTQIFEYEPVKHIYVPMLFMPTQRRGLSEKYLKKRLEKQGWEVWRSALIDITLRPNLYPNVKKKYERLRKLLEKHRTGTLCHLKYLNIVHHGMPDFLCHRNGRFKFVECKLGHEQLQKSQKKCIPKLQQLGFEVEVHKLAMPCTKVRKAEITVDNKQKTVMAKQMSLRMRNA